MVYKCVYVDKFNLLAKGIVTQVKEKSGEIKLWKQNMNIDGIDDWNNNI